MKGYTAWRHTGRIARRDLCMGHRAETTDRRSDFKDGNPLPQACNDHRRPYHHTGARKRKTPESCDSRRLHHQHERRNLHPSRMHILHFLRREGARGNVFQGMPYRRRGSESCMKPSNRFFIPVKSLSCTMQTRFRPWQKIGNGEANSLPAKARMQTMKEKRNFF